MIRDLPEDLLARFTHPDPAHEAVLVASLAHAPAQIVCVAQFAASVDTGGSEIAVVVSDAWQRRGLGGHLLHALMNVAMAAGIERLEAEILADNHAMRGLAQNFGFEIGTHPAAGFLVRATKALTPTDSTHSVPSRYPKIVSDRLTPALSFIKAQNAY